MKAPAKGMHVKLQVLSIAIAVRLVECVACTNLLLNKGTRREGIQFLPYTSGAPDSLYMLPAYGGILI